MRYGLAKPRIKSFPLHGLADRDPMMYITNSPRSIKWSQPTKCHFCSIIILSHLQILPYCVTYMAFLYPACHVSLLFGIPEYAISRACVTLASDSSSHGTSSMMLHQMTWQIARVLLRKEEIRHLTSMIFHQLSDATSEHNLHESVPPSSPNDGSGSSWPTDGLCQ